MDSVSSVKEPSVLIYKIQIPKDQSAFIYTLFESHEGLMSYTTLPHLPCDPHRDLELQIPLGQKNEALELLNQLNIRIL